MPTRTPTRRSSRESALSALYSEEFGTTPASDKWPEELAELLEGTSLTGYALTLFEGVRDNLEAIDERIKECSHHWRLERMSPIDRNILRIGAYEILYVDEVSAPVAINEAIEIARRFGDTESYSFVNGILDSISTSA